MSWQRYGREVYRDRRWPALRQATLRRDGWCCVQCQSKLRLQVDHVLPVRANPELAFDPGNLQVLCGSCHSRKTRIEAGHPPLSEDRLKWRSLVREMTRETPKDAEV